MPRPKPHAVTTRLPHAAHELFELPCVAAVSEDHQQARETVAEQALEQLCAIAVLHARRSDDRTQEQPVGIGEHMALAALDLFACIVAAAQRQKLPAFDALAVDDSGAGHGVFLASAGVWCAAPH